MTTDPLGDFVAVSIPADPDVEQMRRDLLPTMPDELRATFERGEPIWNTTQLQALYTVEGFAAPLAVVRRKSDGVRGTVFFTHSPRYYFGFEEEGK